MVEDTTGSHAHSSGNTLCMLLYFPLCAECTAHPGVCGIVTKADIIDLHVLLTPLCPLGSRLLSHTVHIGYVV